MTYSSTLTTRLPDTSSATPYPFLPIRPQQHIQKHYTLPPTPEPNPTLPVLDSANHYYSGIYLVSSWSLRRTINHIRSPQDEAHTLCYTRECKFISVQGGIYALGRAHMHSTMSLRSFPNGPLSSFQGRSSSERLIPLSTLLSSRRSMV